VQKSWDNIVEHFVDAILDSNTLERFPSMNLKRIKENCGARGERRQRSRISLANSTRHSGDHTTNSVNEAGARLGKGEKENCPGPAYNSSHLWTFCESLGKAMARVGVGERLHKLFVEVDSDLIDIPGDSISFVSVEKECLRRVRLFRGILSYCSGHGPTEGALSFESISNQIISFCCCQLAAIAKGVHYQARHDRNEAASNTNLYKHARLLELQSCYTELTVSLLSWILRECPTSKSTMFESTLHCVRDQFFSRVLLGKKCDIHACLEQLYNVATPEDASSAAAVHSSATLEADESGVLNDIFVAIVRRNREIMVHLASNHFHDGMKNVYCLLNSFTTLATDCKEDSADKSDEWALDSIAKSMDGEHQAALAGSHLLTETSQFQRDLDEYMRHVTLERVTGSEESTCLQQLRQVVIRQFLAPKLLKDDLTLLQKKGILRFSSTILPIETRRSGSTHQQPLELNLIASMVKGIASYRNLQPFVRFHDRDHIHRTSYE
jgi:hypothetical protein